MAGDHKRSRLLNRGGINGSRRGNGNGAKGKQPCKYFARGSCEYGDRCRFSHAETSKIADENGNGPSRARRDASPSAASARNQYNEWRSLIRKPAIPGNLDTMRRVWVGALEILNSSDRDCKQALPRDLDNDSDYRGQQHIVTIMQERTRASQYKEHIEIWDGFLQVITHTAVVDCLSVDTYVGSLYSVMSGFNGKKALPFFQHVCETLIAARTDPTAAIPNAKLDSTLLALADAITELLRREARARYNEDLPGLVRSLTTAAELIDCEESTVTSSKLRRQAHDISSMLERANGLLCGSADGHPSKNPTQNSVISKFIRTARIPGGRHDNDHTDVAKIRIFPTREEILCQLDDILPTTDLDQPHHLVAKAERHIDTQFRLLRHDVFGELKTALRDIMDQFGKPEPINFRAFENGFTRVYPYSQAHVKALHFDRQRGLQVQMRFSQPKSIRGKSSMEISKWWEDSRRLEEGVLLSFIWPGESGVEHMFFTVAKRPREVGKDGSLADNAMFATITIKLTAHDVDSVANVLELSRFNARGVLLEFPHVLPATFVPVLESLQGMQRGSRLPFSDWILPDQIESGLDIEMQVPSPLYARTPGFSFSLDSILRPGADTMSLSSSSSINDPQLLAELEEKTGLDHGQCVALVTALVREYVLIQGPPGTGKSFLGVKLMQVLLSAKQRANLGPVVVVCYTNHALDQFLEHLIDAGIHNVVRIGSQSRSQRLEAHNLRNISSNESKTKQEGWQTHTAYSQLEECEKKSRRILGNAHASLKRTEWKHIRWFLSRKYPAINSQFERTDDEGFTTVGKEPFDIWAADAIKFEPADQNDKAQCSTHLISKAIQDIQSLSIVERRTLLDSWIKDINETAADQLFDLVKTSEDCRRDLKNIHEEVNRRVLQDAQVIGLTTNGLARSIATLQHVRSKVVLCEEAGEVMEPHILSALLPSVEHFIQIGDHQQLRPSINNFRDLSLESHQGQPYQLDRSQFERLTVNQHGRPRMPAAQLNVQRRMRPAISGLIRETIYDKLIDHHTTHQLPDVIGMRKNVFWLDHENLEGGTNAEVQHNQSKSNEWEVNMVHALVRHLVRQGIYSADDIAVLTPYTGQLQKLRLALGKDFEIVISDRDQDALKKDGSETSQTSPAEIPQSMETRRLPLQKRRLNEMLRAATVDNFQGEEAKIVIVSLVRSNKDSKVGFLKTTNRINVLLSRAKHGMYLIGNSTTYAKVPMWQQVIDMLRNSDSIGPALELQCPRHPDTPIQIRVPDDFARSSPEGGCREPCKDRLSDCGHRCQARCHSKAMHDVFRCEQACQRLHKPCGHPCQKATCGEDCGKCNVPVYNVKLPCGHFCDQLACHMTMALDHVKCKESVEKKVPGCGHVIMARCSEDLDTEHYHCPLLCKEYLHCGHRCPGSCGLCNPTKSNNIDDWKHVGCDKICGRPFGTCNHRCERPCHAGSDCGLCFSKCEVSHINRRRRRSVDSNTIQVACKHSRCTLKCHEGCAPCVEPCTWSCPHAGKCNMPCSAPCDRLPCNKRCTQLLPCQHQCPGVCGEVCLPDYCHTCGKRAIEQVDMIEFREFRETDPDETPVVALSCGHFFTTDTLDGLVSLSDVYEVSRTTGEFDALKDISSTLAVRVPKCPHCQRPIQQFVTQRYNRLINRAIIDEMSKRFIVTGTRDLQDFESRVTALEADLASTFSDFAKTTVGTFPTKTSRIQSRYIASTKLYTSIVKLQRNTTEHHQPARKLHEACVRALQRNAPLQDAFSSFHISGVGCSEDYDHRITLGVKNLLIKLQCITFEDKVKVFSIHKASHPEIVASALFSKQGHASDVRELLKSCAKLIETCDEKALPRLHVELAVSYGQIARAYGLSGLVIDQHRDQLVKYRQKALELLDHAEERCALRFVGADSLLQSVRGVQRLLGKEWYEEVTPEEIEAIKRAMVSGPRGIATHSGHWYKCANGHPFAIGECGMPMELARCPECGSPVGGQSHQAVDGVTRATEME